MKKRIAIIGTQGLPNKYGGFETLADYLTKYLNSEFEVTVFCSSRIYRNKVKKYNNSNLVYIPFGANGLSSIFYDSISLLMSLKYHKIIILGASSGLLMYFLRPWRHKFILNCGGIDWKRSKWSFFAKMLIKTLESFAIKSADKIVSDNEGMRKYFKSEYSKESVLIEYGGDQAEYTQPLESDYGKYQFLKCKYAFSVARIQDDNNIKLILESFKNVPELPLVFVGNWNSSSYGLKLKQKFSKVKNIYLCDAIYDYRELNLLRSNCYVYIHGHSAGGTNPALVEAMHLELPIFAFASGFNEYTTENKAIYFNSTEHLIGLLNSIIYLPLLQVKKDMLEIAKRRYQWKLISKKYMDLLN